MTEILTCKACGDPFTVWSPTEFCPSCNLKERRKRQRARRRIHEGRPPIQITNAVCATCGAPFTYNQWSVSNHCPDCNRRRRNGLRSEAAHHRKKLEEQETHDRVVAAILAQKEMDPDT